MSDSPTHRAVIRRAGARRTEVLQLRLVGAALVDAVGAAWLVRSADQSRWVPSSAAITLVSLRGIGSGRRHDGTRGSGADVKLRLSAAERAELERAAGDVPVSAWCRERALEAARKATSQR